MPWKQSTFDAVTGGLREIAQNGQFVPGRWIRDIEVGPDGLPIVPCCGFGAVGWLVAVTLGGVDYAMEKLPGHDTTWDHIEEVFDRCSLRACQNFSPV